jgi:hypothetical protein
MAHQSQSELVSPHSLKSELSLQQVKHLMVEEGNAELETGSRTANVTGSLRKRAESQPAFMQVRLLGTARRVCFPP